MNGCCCGLLTLRYIAFLSFRFFNTSRAIKKHSQKITFGGLSDSPEQAAILMNLTRAVPERENAFDIFTYHRYTISQ